MKSVVLTLSSVLCFIGCTEDNVGPPFNAPSMWSAHYAIQWDSASVANQLIGEWLWVYTYCCGEGFNPEGKSTEHEKLSVVFHGNSTLEVIQNGEQIQESVWTLKLRNDDQYSLTIDPFFSNLRGLILFNKEYVMFNDAIAYGSNNYFRKL